LLAVQISDAMLSWSTI